MTRWYKLGGCIVALVAGGCILDDDRCGAGQRRVEDVYEGCVCAPDFVPNADGIGCHACGKNERAQAGTCVCKADYARPMAGAACEAKTDAGGDMQSAAAGSGMTAKTGTVGQDMPCTSSEQCANTDATFCQTLQAPNICLVQGCARGDAKCAPDRDCCEITILPQLAATGGLCVAKGTCMAPGMLVTP